MAENKELLKAEYVNGNYESLKEFAEKKNLSYDYIRELASKGKWNEEKTHNNLQFTHKLNERINETRIERTLEEFIKRENETLAITALIKQACLNNVLDGTKGKDLISVANALKCCFELEKDILSDTKTEKTQESDLAKLCETILEVSKEGGENE